MSDILSSLDVVKLIATAIVMVFFPAFAALLYYGYNRAREWGLRAPGAIALVAIFWMLALALAFAIPLTIATSFSVSEDYQIFLWILAILIILSITPAFTLLLRALPKRSARVYGKRRVRVPFILLGTVVILISFVLFSAALYGWWVGVTSLLKLLLNGVFKYIVGVLAGVYMIRLGYRLKSSQASAAVLPGHNEPIGALYLRSFREESEYFVYGKKEKYKAYATNFRARVIAPMYGYDVGVTFEEFFRGAVTSSAGPFVALGNPEDYIPPEGASRLYAKDSEWKERLDALARRALWIIVGIGSSGHLSWEFDHLRQEGLQQKLFVITPPAREASRFVWWFIDFNRYINGVGAVSWLQFSEKLASLNYQVDRTDPGPGAVVTFDGNAKSVLLISDAKTPEEFVRAMRDWTSGSDSQMCSKSINSM